MLAGVRGSLDVLLVEDDEPLARALLLHLRAESWTVRWAGDGELALGCCRERLPDVVVLDLMLPGRSGLEVCTELRTGFTPSPGVVMLTARSSEGDVVLGLDHGADDYVVKPCRPKELTARIRALSRRLQDGSRERDVRPTEVALGRLRLDPGTRQVRAGDELLEVTPSEFALLEVFMRNAGQSLSRMDLLERVFESTHAGYARNVDCHVARLRKKLDAAGLKASIETVYGSGYRFVTPDE
jgi:DNA-binding response OmpR family regulator